MRSVLRSLASIACVTSLLMGHIFMCTPRGLPVIAALRRAQVLGYGGDARLALALINCCDVLYCVNSEAFWAEAVHWFCRQPDLDLKLAPSLAEHILTRHDFDEDYNMKGRTVRSVMRDIELRRRDLVREQRIPHVTFPSSGFKAGRWVLRKPDKQVGYIDVTWTLEELRNTRELIREGRALSHCVSDYWDRAANGKSSFWSLREGGVRRVTIEVRNRKRRIVEAAGRFNQEPKRFKWKLIREWCRANGICR